MSIPTLSDIKDSIVSQLSLKLSQTIPLLDKAFTRVLAAALGGQLTQLYKYSGFSFLQLFVQYASAKETTVNGKTIIPLVEWGRLVGAGDPLPAVRAELVIDVTVLVQTGSILAGTQVLFPATGIIYVVKADRELDDDSVQVIIVANGGQDGTDGSGEIGNLQVGDVVQFANPLANISRNATVASVAVTGVDGESTEDYRARVIDRFQARPQGGAFADYRAWATTVTGVVGVFPYKSTTPGEVDVYIEMEATEDEPDGIPTSDQLDAVAAAIEFDEEGLATRRPVTAAVNVLAVTRTEFDIVVLGLEADDEADAKETLEEAVDQSLRALEPFIQGLSVLPRVDRVTSGAIAGVVQDAVAAVGGTVTSVELQRGGDTITAYTLGAGELAKLGTPTYA